MLLEVRSAAECLAALDKGAIELFSGVHSLMRQEVGLDVECRLALIAFEWLHALVKKSVDLEAFWVLVAATAVVERTLERLQVVVDVFRVLN